jgi:hypothetical protein
VWAAVGVVVVACVLGGAVASPGLATSAASLSPFAQQGDGCPPGQVKKGEGSNNHKCVAETPASIADEVKKHEQKADKHTADAHKDDRKAVEDAKDAEDKLQQAKDEAEASLADQKQSLEEQLAADAATDPTTRDGWQSKADADAAKASEERSNAADDLKQAERDEKKAEAEHKKAEEERARAEKEAAEAARKQAEADELAAAKGKILICHATGDAKDPFRQIEVSVNALNGHKGPPDIIPVPAGGCPLATTPVGEVEQGGSTPAEDARAAESEAEKAAALEAKAAEEEARAAAEEALAKANEQAAKEAAAAAAAAEAAAAKAHAQAAAETDPVKAAKLRNEAAAQEAVALSERDIAAIDTALAASESTQAAAERALAADDRAAAQEAAAQAQEGVEFAQQAAQAAGRVVICRPTGQKRRPYRLIVVPAIGLGGVGHLADIIPAPANGCPAAATAKANAVALSNDARAGLLLNGGAKLVALSANTRSVTAGQSLRLALTLVNRPARPESDMTFCANIPNGFSLVSASPDAFERPGSVCWTRSLPARSAAGASLALRLDSRIAHTQAGDVLLRHAYVRPTLTVGSSSAKARPLNIRVTAH